jgi:hypothetical protein
MQERDIQVTVYYYQGDEEWGRHIFDITKEVLPILEDLAGFSYSHDFDVVIYPKTRKETHMWNAQNVMGRGIWINREKFTPDLITLWSYTAVIIHENVHYWSNNAIYGRPCLEEGYAELFTYLAFQRMGREIDALHKKNEWLKTVEENGYYNIPLDLFEYETAGLGNETTILAYSKSALFCLEIYEKYGIEPIQKINEYLHRNGIAADSLMYMNLLEEYTGEDQEELFLKWVFPKKIDIKAWENAEKRISELEELVDSSLSSIEEIYGFHRITDFIEFHMHIQNQITLAKSHIEEHDFEKAIEIITEEIEETHSKMREFDGHAQSYFKAEKYYDSFTSIYRGMPRDWLCAARKALLSLDYGRFTEQITEFSEEMEKLKTYQAFYTEVCLAEDCTSLISLDELFSHLSQEEAMSRVDTTLTVLREYRAIEKELADIDWVTGLGLTLMRVNEIHFAHDMENVYRNIIHGNSGEAYSILTSIQGELLEGRRYGAGIILGGILVTASIFLISIHVMKQKKHDKQFRSHEKP